MDYFEVKTKVQWLSRKVVKNIKIDLKYIYTNNSTKSPFSSPVLCCLVRIQQSITFSTTQTMNWVWNYAKLLSKTQTIRTCRVWWTSSVLLPQSEVLPAVTSTFIPSLLTFLHTEVLGHCLPALLALHGAAPVELTVAARHHLSFALLHGQPALSTKSLAAPLLPFAQVLAFLKALAALCARQAQSAVLQAVIGGVFEVDQLLARDRAEGLSNGAPAGCAVPRSS